MPIWRWRAGVLPSWHGQVLLGVAIRGLGAGTPRALKPGMAAVDSLLQIAREQRADGLILASGEAPVLVCGKVERKLSMPALDDGLIRMFVSEIGDGEVIEIGTAELSHRCEAGAFRVRVHASPGAMRVVFAPNVAEPELVARQPATRPAEPTVESVPSLEASRLARALRACWRRGASDLLVSAGEPIRERVDGVLRIVDADPASAHELEPIVSSPDVASALAEQGSADLALELDGRRFRINIFKHAGGLALAARPVRGDPPTLDSLRLPASLARLAEYRSGLVLVAGPTGSGKSTTVVALVEHLNRGRRKHVITIEDPIEYRYRSDRSLIHQRELGSDVPSFAVGLRAALRENPDVIVVGEMRDPETIAAALTAAELGHLVISTIHSRGAAWALSRVVHGMPSDSRALIAAQLAGSLRAVLTQALVPDTRGGRVVAHELLLNNEAVSQKLREGNIHQVTSLIETHRSAGMRLIEDSLAELVRRGDVSIKDAREAAALPHVLEQLVRG